MDPRTSIVVITRDRGAELSRTLDHLAALPEEPPIIVVDNGSRDDTAARVARHPARPRLIELGRNAGSSARNTGVLAADTPYVAFADDDSWWAPGSLAYAAGLFDRHLDLGLICGRVLVGPEEHADRACERLAHEASDDAPGPGTPIHSFIARAAIVRRLAFLQADGFEPRFGIGGEEELLARDLMATGWRMACVPEITAHHWPAKRRQRGRHRATHLRNELWTAWLRDSAPVAARRSAAAILHAGPWPSTVRGIAGAMTGAPWVVRERQPVEPPAPASVSIAGEPAGDEPEPAHATA